MPLINFSCWLINRSYQNSEMMEICLSNDCFLVWSVEDIRRLRKEFRIVGSLVGCLPSLPRQDHLLGLPMQLMSEEVFLLLTRGVATVLEFQELNFPAQEDHIKERQQIHKKSFLDQEGLFKEERIGQLSKVVDKIVEGKRKKAMKQKEPFDESKALEEEINKIPKMPEDLMMVQIFTRPHWECQGNKVLPFNLDQIQPARLRIFVDLWEKGYYITAGEKFGGDFLVYPGDPLKFHSHYIAVCVEEDQRLTPKFIVQKGRLGTSVKKTVLLCYVNKNGSIKYQSLSWNGK